jgi:hypothetical protein
MENQSTIENYKEIAVKILQPPDFGTASEYVLDSILSNMPTKSSKSFSLFCDFVSNFSYGTHVSNFLKLCEIERLKRSERLEENSKQIAKYSNMSAGKAYALAVFIEEYRMDSF